jgi:polar amino acid transport system substrate-binding protein
MAMPDGSTMKKIQDRGRLIVGVSQDKYAIGFLNPLTNELEGFDVEMAKAMAKAIFGNENKLQIIAVASADRIPLIKAGKVDMVISTFTINAKRKEEINFSEVYYMSGQKILVHKDSPAKSIADLSGQRVCAPAGSTSAKGIVTANPSAKLVETVEFTDCLAKFMMRDVDAISTDDVILAGLAKQDPFAKVVGPSFSAEPYGIGMSKDQPDLVRFVNGVLVQMKSDGSWKRIYDKWFGAMGATEPPRGTYLD